MVFAAGGAGGSVDIVIRLFLYGGMDGLLAFPYRDGPLAAALRLSNIRGSIHPTNVQVGSSTNFSVDVSNLNQVSRNNLFGFHSSWQSLLTTLDSINPIKGLALISEVGITKDNSFSHAEAQGMFHMANNGLSSGSKQGWLGRAMDISQIPPRAVWGLGETNAFIFNSLNQTSDRPLLINSLGRIDFHERNVDGFNCSTCEAASGDKYSSTRDDDAFVRHIMRELSKVPHPNITDSLEDIFEGYQTEIDNTVTIAKKMNNVAVNQDLFRVTPSQGGSINDTLRDVAKLCIWGKSSEAPAEMRNRTLLIGTSLGGWDHHTNILDQTPPLILRLSAALRGLVYHLNQAGLWNRTMIVVETEFGRTTRVNSNNGTDHGWGNPLLILGGQVARKVHGPEGTADEASRQNYFTAQVPISSVWKSVLSYAGFSNSELAQIFNTAMPGDRPFQLI
jgi:uncharacterized protein (DUF1501 family)